MKQNSSEKVIIFDAGALISLSMAGLLDELMMLKKIFNGKFIITSDVKREVIDKPLTIKKFELEALRIQGLLNDKILEMPSSLRINENELSKRTQELREIANSTFYSDEQNIHIIDSGETSCLVLAKMLNEMKIKNVIAIDERTTRVLGEAPENLKKLLENKLHTKIKEKKENFKYFVGLSFIRSTELMYVAYKKGLIKLKDKHLLDAVLYALKFKGSAISREEIEEIKRIG